MPKKPNSERYKGIRVEPDEYFDFGDYAKGLERHHYNTTGVARHYTATAAMRRLLDSSEGREMRQLARDPEKRKIA